MADTARRLRIAEDLPVDDSAATQTIGILARKGGGKRLGTATPIPTPSGWTTMGDLVVGDTVFDEKGRPVTVTFVSEVVVAPSFRVVFSDGEEIVADPEHLWLTWDYAARKRRSAQKSANPDPEWGELRPQCRPSEHTRPQVRTTMEIRETLIFRQGKTQLARNHSIPNTLPLSLPERELPIDPYVLGVWLGDGTSVAGSFTSADDWIVDEVRRLGFDVRLQPSQVSGRARGYCVPGLKAKLRALGVLGAKAIPQAYLRASARQRQDLLQGLMDTDGGWSGSQAEIALSNRDLADGVYELIMSLGMKATWSLRVPTLDGKLCTPSYRIKFSPRVQVFRLLRKATKARFDTQQQERRAHRYIVGVHPYTPVPMRCISVSSESRLYLAGRGMIPTHNTYLASKIVEELYRLECPIVVIDPVGNWWGVTVAANGKDPGLSFVVLGGERGDVELTPEGGAVVAELVMGRNLNVVLDVSSFSKTNMRRFVADFCERFFELSKRRRQARMVVFEEAQRFAPQQFKGQERMLGAVEDIVRLGRNYGLGCILISQRPQSVNKEVLSQVECLFVGQLNEAHARKALLAWIVEKDEDLKSRLGELTTLGRGEFYCWSPSWLRTFKRIKILPKWTFDASSTPKIGEAVSDVGPPVGRLSAEELEGLHQAMHAGDEPPTQGDSRALEQERQLRQEAERRAERLATDLAAREEDLATFRAVYRKLRERLADLAMDLAAGQDWVNRTERSRPPETAPAAPVPEKPTPPEARLAPRAAPVPGIGKCPRAILTVLVQQGKPMSKPRLALMAGYSANSGGFNNALSELRTKGWIEGSGGTLSATTAGSKALGPVPPLPKGSELFAYWHNHPRVDKCARAILMALRMKRQLDKGALAVATNYSANSGGFNNSLSKLRTLGLIEGRGEVTLASDLR